MRKKALAAQYCFGIVRILEVRILEEYVLIPGVSICGSGLQHLTIISLCSTEAGLCHVADSFHDCMTFGILQLFRRYINARALIGRVGGCGLSRGVVCGLLVAILK